MNGSSGTSSSFRRSLPVAVLVFLVSVAFAAPSVHWLDSGNLVASAWTMGLAHPPGEPLWLAFGRIVQLVPIGDIAFRSTLLSVLCLAACAFPLMALMKGIENDGEVEAGRSWRPALLALAVLLGFGAQLQAVRPEVYAPTALLLLLALTAASAGGIRGWAGIGLLLGLGVGLHPLLCAAAAPALVLTVVLRPSEERAQRPTSRQLLGGGIAGLWGLAILAWLPLRAMANPAAAWGVPDTLERFVDVLLARNFSRNFGGESSSLVENLRIVLEVWGGALVPCLLLLLLVPVLRGGAPGRQTRAWMAVTALWMVGNAATILPQNKVFTTNPDLYGYLFIGVLVTLPLALRGLQSLPRLAPLLVGVLIVLQLGLGSQAASADNFLARTFASAQSAGLPPGSVLMTSGNDTAFTWAYLQRVERRRSDLVLLHRVLLGHENERVRLGGEEGLGALGIPWQPEFRSTPSAFLAHLKRPFFIEMREPELEALSMGRLRSHGLVAARRLGDEPWLTAIRSGVFWEFSEPSFSADAEAALVATYYGQLWGAVQ